MLLRAAAFGEISRDLRVAHEIAFRVPDRVDDHVRPKASAVLPHPPALLLEPTLFPRRPQRGLREIDGLVLFGVEPREMLSNDLAFAVALEPLGAAVPARHQASRVQHVDRVIGDPLDQKAVTALIGLSLVKTL